MLQSFLEAEGVGVQLSSSPCGPSTWTADQQQHLVYLFPLPKFIQIVIQLIITELPRSLLIENTAGGAPTGILKQEWKEKCKKQ